MKFNEFKQILSPQRLQRYLDGCHNDKRKTLTLYRHNLHLAQEAFAVISGFEIAIRNAIDNQMMQTFGSDWLRDAILPGGILDKPKTAESQRIIRSVYKQLLRENRYTHTSLLSHMDFGIWKYMFSTPQYRATGKTLLRIFPNKPKSTPQLPIDNNYIFNELDKVNTLRNRIAHHEQICFTHTSTGIDTRYIRNEYRKIITLFQWMGIDPKGYLRGLDHVLRTCDKIDEI